MWHCFENKDFRFGILQVQLHNLSENTYFIGDPLRFLGSIQIATCGSLGLTTLKSPSTLLCACVCVCVVAICMCVFCFYLICLSCVTLEEHAVNRLCMCNMNCVCVGSVMERLPVLGEVIMWGGDWLLVGRCQCQPTLTHTQTHTYGQVCWATGAQRFCWWGINCLKWLRLSPFQAVLSVWLYVSVSVQIR